MAKVRGLLEKHEKCPSLHYLIVMENVIPDDVIESAKKIGAKVMTFNDLMRLGQDQPRLHLQPPKPEDLATICYTSGTTGAP